MLASEQGTPHSLAPSWKRIPHRSSVCEATSVVAGAEFREDMAFCRVDAIAPWLNWQRYRAPPATPHHTCLLWSLVLPRGFFHRWGGTWPLLLLPYLPPDRSPQPLPPELRHPGGSLCSPQTDSKGIKSRWGTAGQEEVLPKGSGDYSG